MVDEVMIILIYVIYYIANVDIINVDIIKRKTTSLYY